MGIGSPRFLSPIAPAMGGSDDRSGKRRLQKVATLLLAERDEQDAMVGTSRLR
jgi:hypothetical protein